MTAKLRTTIALLAALLCLPLFAADKIRTWTDVDGKAMQAQFLREIDGDVTFLKDGKLTTFPLDRLCEQDRELIPKLAAALELEAASIPSVPLPPANLPPTGDSATPPSPASNASEPKPNLTAKRPAAETRTWRVLRGTEVTASFVRMNGRNVVLMRGGRVVTFPYFFLSRGDRDYLTNYLTALGQESQIPVSTPENDPLLQPAPDPNFPPPPAFAGAPQMPPNPGFGGDDAGRAAMAAAEEHNRQAMAVQQERMRVESEQSQQRVAAMSQAAGQQAAAASAAGEAMMNYQKSRIDEYNHEIVGECSNCKTGISRDKGDAKTCPHCGVNWQYRENQFGDKSAIPNALPPNAPFASSSSSPFFEWNDGSFSLFGMSERSSYRLIFRVLIPGIIAIAFGIYRVLK